MKVRIKKFTLLVVLFLFTTMTYAAINIRDIHKYFKTAEKRKHIQINTNFKSKLIYFTVFYNYSEMQPSSYRVNLYKRLYNYLKRYPKYKDFSILIEGYTDKIKPRLPQTIKKYPNLLAYSLGRAKKVKQLFVKWGLNANQIKTAGFAYATSKITQITTKKSKSDTLLSLQQLNIEIPGKSKMSEFVVKGRRVTVIVNMLPSVPIRPTATVPDEFQANTSSNQN